MCSPTYAISGGGGLDDDVEVVFVGVLGAIGAVVVDNAMKRVGLTPIPHTASVAWAM